MGKNAKVDFLLDLDTSSFEGGIKSAKNSVSKLIASGAALASGTKILSSLGKASVSMAATFDQSFAKVSTLFGDVSVDTENLRKKILKMSSSTGIAADELNEGLYSALSAGIPVTRDMSDAMEFLDQATKLSVAGFTSVDKAVDVATTVLNSYGLEASEASSVMDTLIKTQNAGKTTVDELASSLGGVIPAAAATNVEFVDLSAMIAIMTSKGVATAETMTKLKALFVEMQKPTSQLNEISKELWGQTIPEAIAEGGDFLGIMRGLDNAAKAQGKSWVELTSSTEAADAMNLLMSDHGDALLEVMQRMTVGADELGDSYEKMQTPAQNWAKIQQGLNAALIEFGDKILNAINPALEYLADNIETIAPIIINATAALGLFLTILGANKIAMILFSTQIAATGAAIGKFGKLLFNTSLKLLDFSEKAWSATRGVKNLAIESTTIVTPMNELSTVTSYATQNLSLLDIALANLTTKFSRLSGAMTTSFGEMGTTLSTFGTSLITGAQTLSTSLTTIISSTMSSIGTSILSGFGSLGGMLSGGLSGAGGILSTLGTTIVDGLAVVLGSISGVALAVGALILVFLALAFNVGGVTDRLVELLTYLKENWDEILQQIIISVGIFIIKLAEILIIGLIKIGTMAINGFINAIVIALQVGITLVVAQIELMLTGIYMVFRTGFLILQEIVTNGFTMISEIVTTMMDAIKTQISIAWDAITSIFSTAMEAIKTQMSLAWDAIVNQITIIWDGVVNQFKIIWDTITSIFDGFLKIIKGIVTLDFGLIKEGILQIWNSIKDFFVDTWNNITDIFKNTLNNIKNYMSATWDNIKSTIVSIWDSIKSYFVDTWANIKGTIESVWNSIKSFFVDTWEGIKNIFINAINGIKTFISEKFNAIKTFFSEIGEAWKTQFSESWDNIKSVFTDSIDSIKSNLHDKFESMSNFISNIMDQIKGFFKKGWDDIKNVFGSAVDWIYDNTIGRLVDMKNKVKEIMGDIKGSVGGVISKINPFDSPGHQGGTASGGQTARSGETSASGIGIVRNSNPFKNVTGIIKARKMQEMPFDMKKGQTITNQEQKVIINKMELPNVKSYQDFKEEMLDEVDFYLGKN